MKFRQVLKVFYSHPGAFIPMILAFVGIVSHPVQIICVSEAYGKRVTMKMKTPKHKNETPEEKYFVCRYNSSSVNDSIFRKIVITGYDKTNNSSKESFFITNRGNKKIAGLELEIRYLTMDGRKLHHRKERLIKSILPAETYKFDIDSWDSQHSFHYHKSEAPKHKQSIPYTVKITPVALYLSREEK